MSRQSFDDARRAADNLQREMARAKTSHRLQTKEQLQAAGFAPQPKTDPNAGLPRYEDVVGKVSSDDQVERAAEEYLNSQPGAAVEFPPGMIKGIARNYAPQPEPQPQNDIGSVVALLMQQQQTLMQENTQLRQQLMQLMQMAQNGAAQPQGPKPIPRASQLNEQQQWAEMHSGRGLLG